MIDQIPGFRAVPRTGVIYVTTRAAELGFTPTSSEWINLGQGSPETGPIPNAPARIETLNIDPNHQGYAPISGNIELRQKVADFYNRIFRQGQRSLYTYENVSIASGGRTALTRLAAALGNVNMGHFLPDYTAYEELLGIFKAFTPIPILLNGNTSYHLSTDMLRNEILGRGLRTLLFSNPSNPTGQLTEGERLHQWVQLAREIDCTLILDEFYSHYIYSENASRQPNIVSACAYVEDVNRDPIIIVDGLTKNWRYPGWRISWTIGPRSVIEAITSAGSFLDGGANNPFQDSAVALLEPELVMQETCAIQEVFRQKRDYMLQRLRQMNISVESEPCGTFYVWANLAKLPDPLRDGMRFFEEGLKEKVITVPGYFFDVNPNQRRKRHRFGSYSRISFGPELVKLALGLNALERVIGKVSRFPGRGAHLAS